MKSVNEKIKNWEGEIGMTRKEMLAIAAKEEIYSEGVEDGEKKRNGEIALNMLRENLDVNLISKITNLSVAKINKIKEKL